MISENSDYIHLFQCTLLKVLVLHDPPQYYKTFPRKTCTHAYKHTCFDSLFLENYLQCSYLNKGSLDTYKGKMCTAYILGYLNS